ncbi:MAG: hypothetical protein JW769_01620 [Parachlamydiales bacterium]|nr:hypothetical protein [Parachlamydiales bacterium]
MNYHKVPIELYTQLQRRLEEQYTKIPVYSEWLKNPVKSPHTKPAQAPVEAHRETSSTNYRDIAIRVGKVALPFFELYSPIGKVSSLTKNSYSIYEKIIEIVRYIKDPEATQNRKRKKKVIFCIIKISLSILSITGILISLPIGFLAGSSYAFIQHSIQLVQNIHHHHSLIEVAPHFSLLLNDIFRIATIWNRALWLIIGCSLFTIGRLVYSAIEERKKERILECCGLASMAAVRTYKIARKVLSRINVSGTV